MITNIVLSKWLNIKRLQYLGCVAGHYPCSLKISKLKGPAQEILCLFVFVALRPMSTAMVIAGRSVHLTTLFPGQA